MNDWKDAAAFLLRRVVSGVGFVGEPRPIYLLSAAEAEAVDPRLTFHRFSGWTSPVADLLFADYLRQRDQWEGRGFAMVIDDRRLQSLPAILGAVLHELAHCIENELSAPVPATKPDCKITRELATAALGSIPAKWEHPAKPVRPKPWDDHGSAFVRICCHLAHRGGEVIESVRPHHVCFGVRYYGQPFSENTWLGGLSGELTRSDAILALLAEQPPEAFSELYSQATAIVED